VRRKTHKSINTGGNWVSSCLSFFLSASAVAIYLYFHLLPPVQLLYLLLNLVHYMLSFSVSYPDLIKFSYFANTTKRGVCLAGERMPKLGWLSRYRYYKSKVCNLDYSPLGCLIAPCKFFILALRKSPLNLFCLKHYFQVCHQVCKHPPGLDQI
jgi:hypothetical protein